MSHGLGSRVSVAASRAPGSGPRPVSVQADRGSSRSAGPLRGERSRLPRAHACGHSRSRPPGRAWTREDTSCPSWDTTNHREREVVRKRAAQRDKRLDRSWRPRPPGCGSCALPGVAARSAAAGASVTQLAKKLQRKETQGQQAHP